MELFTYMPVQSYEYNYIVRFNNKSAKALRYFNDFNSLVITLETQFDPFTRGWKIKEKDLAKFIELDKKIFPQKPRFKTMKEKMSTLIKIDKKEVTDWEDIGQGMKLKPYDYQKEVIKFIVDNKNALIVSPCGSGKTPMGIGAYLECHNRGIIKGPGLIVVKASLKTQWKAEVKKFTDLVPSVLETYSKVTSYENSQIKAREKKMKKAGISEVSKQMLEQEIEKLKELADKKFLKQFEDADLFIANYETLRDDEVLNKLKKMKIDFIFADEVHYVKESSNKRSKALYKLNKATVKVGATATPVKKDPRDIYGIFKFINPELFPNKKGFDNLYMQFAGGGNWGRPIGAKNEEMLNGKISPNMIIKTKEEVAKQLPGLVVVQKYCELEPAQQDVVQKLFAEMDELHEQEKEFLRSYTEAQLANNEDYQKIGTGILARQQMIREIADSEQLLKGNESKLAQRCVTGSRDNKMDLLVDTLNEILESGEKVCIFSRYVSMQKIIADRVAAEFDGVKIAYLNGSMNSEERYDEVYNKFRDNDEYKILIMSDAGTEGINLSTAKYLIEMEPADSYADQTQRHGRLERADSIHDTVYAIQLIAKDSWDEISLKIIGKKEGYDNRIIKGISEE